MGEHSPADIPTPSPCNGWPAGQRRLPTHLAACRRSPARRTLLPAGAPWPGAGIAANSTRCRFVAGQLCIARKRRSATLVMALPYSVRSSWTTCSNQVREDGG
eukprot:364493-Chlamydomonas_euryale.AAC.17